MADIQQSDFISFTDTDFSSLQQQLIDYITNQSEFTDQNTEGSNFQLMTGLLAYISEILSFNLNNAMNERFLNTALLRSNILKLLKTISYTPYQKQSSKITLDLYVPYDESKKNYYLQKYDSVTSGDFIFYYIGEDKYPSIYLEPLTNNKFLKYSQCEFYEGKLIVSNASTFNLRTGDDIEETNEFYTGTGENNQTFEIFDEEMGEHHRVLQNKNNTIIEWELFDELTDYVNASETELFFLEEIDRGYQFEFGNNKLGKAPTTSDEIGYIYIKPTGADANSLTTFTFNNGGTISSDDFGTTGFIEPPDSDDFKQNTYGGGEKETIEEIKFNAPKFFNTLSRAVTTEDYKTIALRNPLIEKANVIGGENVISSQTSNKMLGKVYIYVKPDLNKYPNNNFTTNILSDLKDYFKQYSVVTIDPIVNNVSYLYYRPYIELKYTTEKAPDEEAVKENLDTYMSTEQGQFGEYFEESKFLCEIEGSDPLITSVVFHSEKYIELKNGTSIEDPNNYEFKTQKIPADRTGVYKLILSKYLQKWKIDFRQTITKLEYNFLDFDPNGNPLELQTGDLTEEIENPWYGRRVPSTRLETYVYVDVDNETVEKLTSVSFPHNHPGIDNNVATGEDQYIKYYYLMYGENPVSPSKEFYPEEAGRTGSDPNNYLYDPTVYFYSEIFNWDEEEFNYGNPISFGQDDVIYDRPEGDEAPGQNGKLTLYACTEFVSQTGDPQIVNQFPKLDFSDLQNYEDLYPHNVVSFIPHMVDTEVVNDNNNYRALDYWFVMGERVSNNNTIKYTKIYNEINDDPNDRYWMKLYLDEGDQVNINQYNFDTESTENTTLTQLKTADRLFSTINTGEDLSDYYVLVNTPSFDQNMLFRIVDTGSEKVVTDEGNVEEFSIKVISNGSSFDSGTTSYITFTTIDSSLIKTNYYIWFNVTGHGNTDPLLGGTGIQVNVDPSDTITNIADAIDTAVQGLTGVDYSSGAYDYNDVDTITLVNEGSGSLSPSEAIETNDYQTFFVNRDVQGNDDIITAEPLVYVKIEHVADINSQSSFDDFELEQRLIYHNENYDANPQSGLEYKLDFEANLIEDFEEIRSDQTFEVYRRVLYDASGSGLPDPIPDTEGGYIENTDLEDGELIEVLGINDDGFNDIFRISANGVNYASLRTDIKTDTNVSTRYSSEIPYLDPPYTLELPGKLNKEKKTSHRFYFEVIEKDIFVQKDQILDVKQDDIEITTTPIVIENSQEIT